MQKSEIFLSVLQLLNLIHKSVRMSASVKKKIRVGIRSGATLSSLILTLIFCVTPPGFEPRQAVPKTDVLPLHHEAIHLPPFVRRSANI